MVRRVLVIACLAAGTLGAQAPSSQPTPAPPTPAQTAAKKAAIQKACAAGVLSPEECQAKLAALSPATTPPATATGNASAGHWSEPHGRYTIAIAPGWQIDSTQANLKVTKGSSWAIFDTESKPGSALDVANRNAKEMGSMVSGWKVVQQQPFDTPRHHPAAGVTALAQVPTRGGSESRVLTFAAQSAGSGNFVTLTASSLEPDARADQGQLMAMFNSVRFAGEQ